MTIFDKIKELADKQGVSVSKVATDLGFSENLFYQWKTSSPQSDRLEKVADYFGVSVDYLLGRENKEMNMKLHTHMSDDNLLTEKYLDFIDLQELLASAHSLRFGGIDLDKEDRERINQVFIQVFWERLKKKEESE